jgi:hypothetical protein
LLDEQESKGFPADIRVAVDEDRDQVFDTPYDLLIARGRQALYTAILTASLGDTALLHILKHFLSLLNLDAESLYTLIGSFKELLEASARKYRIDLDPVSRDFIPKAIVDFYTNAGYSVEAQEPDTLRTMIAFMARLARDEADALEKGDIARARTLRTIQLRFINIHIKPLLNNLKTSHRFSDGAEILMKIFDADTELLKNLLTSSQHNLIHYSSESCSL